MRKLYNLFLVFITLDIIVSCASFGDSKLPLTLKTVPSAQISTNLLVMFPGINSPGEDFQYHGFVQLFQKKYPNVDIILVDTRYAYTQVGNLSVRIQTEIILPALSKGYTNIWLVGVSLGALGVIRYSELYPNNLNGMVLIAPYLGNQFKIKDFLSHQ